MDIEHILRIASRGILMIMAGFFLGTLAGAVIGAGLGASMGPMGYLIETAPDAEHQLMAWAMQWFLSWTPMGAFASIFMGAIAGFASGTFLGGCAATGLALLGTLQRWFRQLSRQGSQAAQNFMVELLGVFYGPLGGAVAGTWVGWLAGFLTRELASTTGPSFTLGFLGGKGGALIGLAIGLVLGPAFLRKTHESSKRTVPLLLGMVIGVSIAGSIGLILGAVAGWTFESWRSKLAQSKLGELWPQWPAGVLIGIVCGFFVGGFDGIVLGGLAGWGIERWQAKRAQAALVPTWVGPPPAEIHIARGGQIYGPYSREGVHQQLQDGTLQKNDWAWAKGAPQWLGLYAIPLQEPALALQASGSVSASHDLPSAAGTPAATAPLWRSSLISAASSGFDAGVVSGALLGATTLFYFPASFLASTFLAASVGGVVVAIGACLVAWILRRTSDIADGPRVDAVVGALVGGLIGGLGEQVYLLFGGELIVPFSGPFEHELVRALVGALVGSGVGWLVGRRLRREQLLPAMPLLEA